MKQYMFGNSMHTARKQHRCDRCFDIISPGEKYNRWIWIPKRGYIHVMKEHADICPIEEMSYADILEHEHINVAIALEARAREVVMINMDGTSETRTEIEYVPAIVAETGLPNKPTSDYDDEDDIPF